MELIRGLQNLHERHRGCVVTIGNFDGVHRGHQALIARVRQHAAATGLPATVLTFEPTPREFFSPGDAPPRVQTLRDKLATLEMYGIDRMVIARFDQRIAGCTPEQFVDDLLIRRLGVKAVVVGDDFRYGNMRRGESETLRQCGREAGFAVEGLESVVIEGERCSSTQVRSALAQADLQMATGMLGRPYRISGPVRHGLRLGRELGMPTANIALRRPLALRQGVYAVLARCEGRQWGGVASLGVRPTLGMSRCLLETHVFGEPGSLYGRVLEVEFRAWLRGQEKFDSLEALAAQMQRDAEQAKQILATPA